MAALNAVLLPDDYEVNILNTPVDPSFVAGDLAGDTFPMTGKQIILVRNTGVAPHTVTVVSQPSQLTERTGDITAASIPIGATRVFQLFKTNGWRDTNGVINLTVSDVALELAAIQLR